MAKRTAKKAAPKRPAKAKSHSKPAKKAAASAKPKASPSKPAGKPTAKPAAPGPVRVFRQPPPPPPPPPLATPKPPAADAVLGFERGMAQLQRHDYTGAKATFQGLLDNYPSEGFLTDRARVYLQLADRELQRRPASSVEERLTAATAALNNNDDAEAGRLAESAFKDDRSADLAAYLMAIVAARQGRTDDALKHIKTAIEINPDSRVQARQDEEFDILLDLDEFHALTEAPPAPSPAQPSKKPFKKGR
jgi:tetratricopeptide (TPR) repeat protein